MDRGNSTPYEENSALPALPALPAQPASFSASPALPALPFGDNSALPSGGSYVTMAAECDDKGGVNMGIDIAKRNARDRRWKEKAYSQKAISFRIDSGVPDALDKMKETTGQSISNYIIMATTRQLIADGYLQQSTPSNEPEE